MYRKQKKAFTLLEIMIVILLIGLIGSVIGYNMKGSLDEGRAFKTKQAIVQIKDILELELAKNDSLTISQIVAEPEKYLALSGLVKNPDKMLMDGWGAKLVISADNDTIKITSTNLETYNTKKGITN